MHIKVALNLFFSVPILYLWALGSAEAQSSTTLPPLLHILYDGTGLSGHDALLYNPKHLSGLLLRLLDQTMGQVQDPETLRSQERYVSQGTYLEI